MDKLTLLPRVLALGMILSACLGCLLGFIIGQAASTHRHKPDPSSVPLRCKTCGVFMKERVL